MKKSLFIGALAISSIAAFAAFAQVVPSLADQAEAAIITLQVDLNNAKQALEHAHTLVSTLNAEAAKMHQREAVLDAYLKACGDKPGCTQPIK